ncbi:MAG: zinc ribbon domain-containing protein [Porcipelethomonas sp.]
MGLLDKLSDAGRSASEKTKNMSDSGNLKRKILYEEERIVEILTDIGKAYYKNPDDTEEMKALCDDIDTRKRRIKKMRFELQSLKGVRICPKCQAEVMDKFLFCGVCGAKLPTSEDDFD